jgi:tRNA(Ile)-lysidine synthase
LPSNASALADAVLGHALQVALDAVPEGAHLTVAYSGGLDSTVLLHVAATALTARGYSVDACHIHHGLSPNADAWATHCASTAAALGIPLAIHRVTVTDAAGEGIEAAARAARYAALARANAAAVLLAHHERDQAETLLIQLFRGAGAHGMAAMPAISHRGGMRFIRPWLAVKHAQLCAYAQAHDLRWIDDESNNDTEYTRNWVRHTVLPPLTQRSPSIIGNVARAARQMASAADLLDDLARQDMQVNPVGGLLLAPLQPLRVDRRCNVLRLWLRQHHLRATSTARLEDVHAQLLHACDEALIAIDHDGAVIRRYQGIAYVTRGTWEWQAPIRWLGEERLHLRPAGGQVSFLPAKATPGRLRLPAAGEVWELGKRSGGERFAIGPTRPRRNLKQHFQSAQLPPWLRANAPVLRCDGDVAWVAGVGVAAPYWAKPEEEGITLDWDALADAAPTDA